MFIVYAKRIIQRYCSPNEEVQRVRPNEAVKSFLSFESSQSNLLQAFLISKIIYLNFKILKDNIHSFIQKYFIWTKQVSIITHLYIYTSDIFKVFFMQQLIVAHHNFLHTILQCSLDNYRYCIHYTVYDITRLYIFLTPPPLPRTPSPPPLSKVLYHPPQTFYADMSWH